MIDSILTSIKKNLGVAEAYTAFDDDITLYINSAFADLLTLGAIDEPGFRITDAAQEWSAVIPDDDPGFDSMKQYVTISVKLIWDPPQTSFAIASLEKQLDGIGWRLKLRKEELAWKALHPDAS